MLDPAGSEVERKHIADRVDHACRTVGFFGITGHGIPGDLQDRMDHAARRFFEHPDPTKAEISMDLAGPAWRGWFPVEGELTSGRPDRKEGIYFGAEHGGDHPRVRSSTPLHGPNRFPAAIPELRDAVLEWLDALRPVADGVMRAMALGLGFPARWFEEHLTDDPTVLFRIFHYPPPGPAAPDPSATAAWGVGEHTDYGLLTLLAQDHHGGLQVKALDGDWIDVPPADGVIVCNLGDMLERLTGGVYRSTPHRVLNISGQSRLSFPYFFDPSWDATVPTLPIPVAAERAVQPHERWDGEQAVAWEGTYGDYLTAKVAKVFPELFGAVTPPSPEPQ